MSLAEILDAKEARWNQKRVYAAQEKRCVVSLTLRMPSEMRLSRMAEKALSEGSEEVFALLKNAFHSVSFKGEFSSPDGRYALFTVCGAGEAIKKHMIRFEEESRIGDFIDADVMTEAGEEISRLAVGGEARRCLVCKKNDARVCMRRCAHNRADTIKAIEDELKKRLSEGEQQHALDDSF